MGSFANTLFLGMLGWIRSVASFLWDFFTHPSSVSSFANWMIRHWLLIVIVLCFVGLVADWIVYLIRWRPYRVWGSFFRRVRSGKTGEEGPDAENDAAAEEDPSRFSANDRECFSVPSDGINEAYEPAADNRAFEARQHDEYPADTELPSSRSSRFSLNQAETNEDLESFSDHSMTERFEQAIRPQKRRSSRVARFFREEDSETDYIAPQDLIDRREAYRSPVYPSNWKNNIRKEEESQE